MRWLLPVLALVACSKKDPAAVPASGAPGVPGPGSGAGAGDAAVTPDDAGLGGAQADAIPIELLHAVPASVEVSSHVANKTIKPEHLVDRDLQTAWNSRTGELVGAWLEVSVPGATIHDLRLTVGHTGKGPKGQDYFTMNPRIRKVSVLQGETVLVTATLDVARRDLQTITLPVPMPGPLRLRIDDVTKGTKARWREVCISELEAWGVAPAGITPAARVPVVSVHHATPAPSITADDGKPVDLDALCASLLEPLQEAYEAAQAADERHREACQRANRRHPEECDTESELAPPACGSDDARKVTGPPWTDVEVLRVEANSAHGPMSCQLAVSTDAGTFLVGDEVGCGPWDDAGMTLREVTVEDAVPGGPPELVIRYAASRGDTPVHLVVCRAGARTVSCTAPFVIEDAGYEMRFRFDKGSLVLETAQGAPPAGRAGRHALTFL